MNTNNNEEPNYSGSKDVSEGISMDILLPSETIVSGSSAALTQSETQLQKKIIDFHAEHETCAKFNSDFLIKVYGNNFHEKGAIIQVELLELADLGK